MRATSFAKFGIGLTALALLSGALVTPANADPSSESSFGTLVGVGSDTTQDLMNGIAGALGGVSNNPRIASYDAVNSTGIAGGSIVTRKHGTSINRPNGSGAGVNALLVSIGQSASLASAPGTWTTADTLGQVDFARSSSGPSAAVAGGVVTYVPYARDAVDYATAETTNFPQLTIGSASDTVDQNGVGESTLFSIYSGKVNEIATGGSGDPKLVSWAYEANSDETLTPIHAYVPQAGSGTRKFWDGASVMAVNETDVDANGVVFDKKVTGGTSVTDLPTPVTPAKPVQEHDGTVLENDLGAIMPFSVGKWITDANNIAGVTDARNGAVLGKLANVSPTTGTDGAFALNPDYLSTNSQVTRLVYNVIPTAAVADGSSLTNWAFVGTGSLVCSQTDTIKKYGFGVLTAAAPSASACGDTSRQAFAPSPATVTFTTKTTSLSYGAKFSAVVGLTSVGNGGASVVFKNGDDVIATFSIPKGATTATFSVPAVGSAAGTWHVTADVTPNVTGANEAVTAAKTITVKKASVTVKGSDASVSHTVSSTVKVAVTATGFVPTGTVTIKSGSTVLASNVALDGTGHASTEIAPLKKGKHTLTVVYSGSNTTSAKTSTFKFTSK
jgi:hypothetical protein